MQEGKENDFQNFGKLLKKLETSNVGISELRQLKQEHAYLQKLKIQRIKIEELKTKYDSAEHQINIYVEDMQAQKQLIDEQHRTIQLLQNKLEQSERKRNHLDTTVAKNVQIQRQRQRVKQSELLCEIEELRKENKHKDLLIFQMEDQLELQKNQLREQSVLERKRITAEWEEKIKTVISESSQKDKQNQDLKELVTRQHKALQLQNEQFEECSQKNEELDEVVAKLEEELGEALKLREEGEERLAEAVEVMNKMEIELAEYRDGQSAKGKVEELRKKVNELAKDEIERIEFIVSQFD